MLCLKCFVHYTIPPYALCDKFMYLKHRTILISYNLLTCNSYAMLDSYLIRAA